MNSTLKIGKIETYRALCFLEDWNKTLCLSVSFCVFLWTSFSLNIHYIAWSSTALVIDWVSTAGVYTATARRKKMRANTNFEQMFANMATVDGMLHYTRYRFDALTYFTEMYHLLPVHFSQ